MEAQVRPSDGRRLLVAENDVDLATVLIEMLNGPGFSVAHAQAAANAIRVCDRA